MNYLYLSIILFVLSELLVFKLHHFYAYPINLILFQLICCVIGNIYLLDTNASIKYILAYTLFFLGYCFRFLFKKEKDIEEVQVRSSNNTTTLSALVFTVIITIASYYHIIVIGIPLFSSNIEVTRFDFTSSGFFGVPGRLYLFGYMFLIPYLYFLYNKNNSKSMKRLIRVTWILYIVISILGGFKSSITALIYYFINVKALIGKPIKIKKIISTRYLIIAATAIIFAVELSKLYKSVNVQSTTDSINYLFTRLFASGSRGGNILLNKEMMIPEQKIIYNDFFYFMAKYLHITLTNFILIPMSKLVSAYNLHIYNINDNIFLAPYTLGAFPELYFDFGYMSYLLMFVLGIIYAFLCSYKTNGIFKQACISFSVVFLLNSYITKGSLMYCLFNYVLMIMIFKIIEIFGKDVSIILTKNKYST